MKWSVLLSVAAFVLTSLTATREARCADAVARPRIVLLVEDNSKPLTRQLKDELSAFGFDSLVLRWESRVLSPAQVQAVAKKHSCAAALRVQASSGGVEVWIADRMTGKTTMREMVTRRGRPGSEQSPRLVAIQTVELLRASLLEVQLEERPNAPVQIPEDVRANVMEERRKFSLAFGIGTIGTFSALPPALQAGVEGTWRPLANIEFGATGSLPALPSVVSEDEGKARIRMARAGLFSRVLLGRSTARVVPTLGLGADALFTHATGEGVPGLSSRVDQSWRWLLRGELGATARLTRRMRLSLDAWMGGTPQRVIVRFNDAPVATIGPLLYGSSLKLAVDL